MAVTPTPPGLAVATLYGIPGSHPAAAAAAALGTKRVPFRRVDLLPLIHKPIVHRAFGAGTVPALEIDGRRVSGSTAIFRMLDTLVADPPLFADDDVASLEAWGESELQAIARRVTWALLLRRPFGLAGYASAAELPLPAWATTAGGPAVIAAEVMLHRAFGRQLREGFAALPSALSKVAANLDVLLPTANAAALQIGSSLALLGTHQDLRDRFDSHPAWEVADRWFPGCAGHTPKGTAKRQWLELIGDTHG